MTIFDPRKQKTCRTCGAELTHLQAFQGDVCERIECRGAMLQRIRDDDKRRFREAREKIANQAILRAGLEITDDDLVAVVPHFNSQLIKLPVEILDDFTESVRNSVAQAAENWSPKTAQQESAQQESTEQPQQPNDQPQPYMVSGCMTCGGRCCNAGGSHAFINQNCVDRVWTNQPDLEAEQIVQLYLESLPEKSFAGSCVYHSEHGCTLARELRSDVCNEFFCSGLADHQERLVQLTPNSCTEVSIDDDGEVQRMISTTGDGERTVHYDRNME